MARWPLLAVASLVLFSSGLWAQAENVSREYLAETVQRGLPVLALPELTETVPYWPALEARLRSEKATHPSQDLSLVEGWMLLQQQRVKEASQVLTGVWVQGNGTKVAFPVVRAEAWFSVLSRLAITEDLLNSWSSWDQKALSATAVSIVLPTVATAHPTAVAGIVKQAFALYPEDHRWLPWMLENAPAFPQVISLVRRDRTRGPGLTPLELRNLLRRKPDVRQALITAGYTPVELDGALSLDYTAFVNVKTPVPPLARVLFWDQDRDGQTDHRVVFDQGRLLSWSRGALDPQAQSWTLAFSQGRPAALIETRRDSVWTLDWEDYPWISRLKYRYGTHEIEYRFAPYIVSVPLSPRNLASDQEAVWPWQWDQDGKEISLPSLVTQAASVVTTDRGRWLGTLSLASGQVWMSVESTKGDGNPDQWSFYRGGKLDRIYRSPGQTPTATLQELYSEGEYQAFLADPSGKGATTFALFPEQEVQLWDPEGSGSPLIRWVSDANDGIRVLAFRGETLPWSTMPPWDPLP